MVGAATHQSRRLDQKFHPLTLTSTRICQHVEPRLRLRMHSNRIVATEILDHKLAMTASGTYVKTIGAMRT